MIGGHLNANSVPKYFTGIEHFLIMNDRVFNWTKLHKMFPSRKKESGSESYTTEQIQRILSFTKSLRSRFVILLFCSTGCRLGAIQTIKLDDVKKIEDCYYLKLYAGETEESIAFLTPEASKVFELYKAERERDGEQFNKSSPLVREHYKIGFAKVRSSTTKSIEAIVHRLIRKAGIERVKEGGRYNIQADHGFRKWYKTQIAMTSGIPFEMSKKLIQHKDLEGRYTTPKPEQLFEFFKLAIPNLTIDDSERKNLKIEKLEKEKSETEKMKEKFELDHQLLQMLAHSVQGTGVQLVKPDGKPYEIDPEVIKKVMKDYVEPVEMKIDESLAKNKIKIKV